MQESGSINVVIIEPQALLRDGVAALLSAADGFVVAASASTAIELEPALQVRAPDVVVLGLGTPAAGAFAALDALPRLAEITRTLVVTSADDAAVYERAIELGAHGVLSPEQPGPVLCQAIRAIHGGELWLDRRRTSAVVSYLARGRASKDVEQTRIESLTPREREIVLLITEGLRNKQVAERLLIGEATVRNHLTSILDKLELAGRFELAVYAFRRGLVSAAAPGATPVIKPER